MQTIPLGVWALLAWMSIGVPLVVARSLRRLNAAPESAVAAKRREFFSHVGLLQGLHLAMGLWALHAMGIPLSACGFPGRYAYAYLAGIPAFLLVSSGFHYLRIRLAERRGAEPYGRRMVLALRRALPETTAERGLWVLLSLGAGASEGLLWRALLLHVGFRCGLAWEETAAVSAILYGLAAWPYGIRQVGLGALVGGCFFVFYIDTWSLVGSASLHAAAVITGGAVVSRWLLAEAPKPKATAKKKSAAPDLADARAVEAAGVAA
ncbi:MAG: hypothetical protein HYZ53_05800 [Planctomycetes bacterium]|nr:hypothetical protein [Planctomycetota bacterium]